VQNKIAEHKPQTTTTRFYLSKNLIIENSGIDTTSEPTTHTPHERIEIKITRDWKGVRHTLCTGSLAIIHRGSTFSIVKPESNIQEFMHVNNKSKCRCVNVMRTLRAQLCSKVCLVPYRSVYPYFARVHSSQVVLLLCR